MVVIGFGVFHARIGKKEKKLQPILFLFFTYSEYLHSGSGKDLRQDSPTNFYSLPPLNHTFLSRLNEQDINIE